MLDAEDFTRALQRLDEIKHDLAGEVALADVGATQPAAVLILERFGVDPAIAMGFAHNYSRDVRAVVTEAGGDEDDVRATVALDCLMIGVALGVLSPRDHLPEL